MCLLNQGRLLTCLTEVYVLVSLIFFALHIVYSILAAIESYTCQHVIDLHISNEILKDDVDSH